MEETQQITIFLVLRDDLSVLPQKNTILKLNDIRTVSVNRILYQQKGDNISISSDTYKKIEELVLQKYFPSFMYDYRQMEEKMSDLESTMGKREEELKAILDENEKLKEQIEKLKIQISNYENI